VASNDNVRVTSPDPKDTRRSGMDGRTWALRERVFKAVDTLVMARILEMPPGNAERQKFRLRPAVPKIDAYIFTTDAKGVREPARNCYLLKDVIFDQLGAIPTYCMTHCWKIVIKVRTVAELFALLSVMQEHAWPGKCGFDSRNYTFGNYVGFCYFESREHAEREFPARVEAVKERIPGAHLYLKRSCTEFEMRAPSNTWNPEDPLADALAEFLATWVEWETVTHNQTEYVVERVKSYWIERAYNLGDPTIEQVMPDYRKMYPQSVRYMEST
jgi:hypothetical protein